MKDFEYELEALGRWVKATANLNSMRLMAAPPRVARPIILWEAPQRQRLKNTARYLFVNQVRQYGKLFAKDLDQLLEYQTRLQLDLEDRENTIDIFGADGQKIGWLKNISMYFETSVGLDVPFQIEYEVGYARNRPVVPPPPKYVHTRTDVTGMDNS